MGLSIVRVWRSAFLYTMLKGKDKLLSFSYTCVRFTRPKSFVFSPLKRVCIALIYRRLHCTSVKCQLLT